MSIASQNTIETILSWAVKSNQPNLCSALLDLSSTNKPNATSINNALTQAVEFSHSDIVTLILDMSTAKCFAPVDIAFVLT